MRKQIIILLAVLFMVVPVFAQDEKCGAYPDDLQGEEITSGYMDRWVTPSEARYYPWSMPDFPYPPTIGYGGDFYFTPDGVEITLGPLVGTSNRFIAPPPPGYNPGEVFQFNEQAGCYIREVVGDDRIEFEAWVFRSEGKSQWITGCLKPGGTGWLVWDESCIWTAYDIDGTKPVSPSTMRGTRRLRGKK